MARVRPDFPVAGVGTMPHDLIPSCLRTAKRIRGRIGSLPAGLAGIRCGRSRARFQRAGSVAPIETARLSATPLPGEGIDDRQDAERPAIVEGVAHEVHAPPFVRRRRRRRHDAKVTGSLPPLLRPDLQAFEFVETVDAFDVHPPALPSEQHVQSGIAEPRPCGSELAQSRPQRRLVLRLASPVERRRTSLQARCLLTLNVPTSQRARSRSAAGLRIFFAGPPAACVCRG